MPGPTRSASTKEITSEKQLITRACDTCRKKKIKCTPIANPDSEHGTGAEVCAQCVKSKSECHFTPISVLRSRRWLLRDRDRRVEELEKRLAAMEEKWGKLPLEDGSPGSEPSLKGQGQGGGRPCPNANREFGGDGDAEMRDANASGNGNGERMDFDDYEIQNTYIPDAVGEGFLGSAMDVEESVGGSQTSNTVAMSEDQASMVSGDTGTGELESDEEFLRRLERMKRMRSAIPRESESVEEFMKRMERVRAGDCGGCSLVNAGVAGVGVGK